MAKSEWLGRNRQAIALLRVSSSGQEGNTSWLIQKRDCEDYCRLHDLDLVDAVAIVESASKPTLRKKYGQILQRARIEDIHHILFHKFDRETRNLTDNEHNEIWVREGKVVLHYVAEGKILHKGSPDTDFLMRDFQAVQNKHYSRDLSSKVRKATQMKASSGHWPGCRPPDGYIQQKQKSERGFDRRRGSVVVPDPNIQTVRRVQREFEMRAETPTPTFCEIRNRIIVENLVPTERIKKYHIGAIERRLKNIFYDGRFEWNGVEFNGKHERIVPPMLFWKVQETFGKKNFFRKNPDALFGHGWLYCAEPDCGCAIIYDPKVKKIKSTGETKIYKYYRCSNGRKVHANLKGMIVSEGAIMDQFAGAVRKISIRDDFRNELMRAVNETHVKMKRAVKVDLDGFKAALTSVDHKENRTYDRYDSGELDRETYNNQRKRLQDERNHYTELMRQAQLGISDAVSETVESIIELATNAESLWKHMTTEERRFLLDKLLSNRWLDGVNVRYEIVKPLQTLSEMKEDQNWRARVDDFITECLRFSA